MGVFLSFSLSPQSLALIFFSHSGFCTFVGGASWECGEWADRAVLGDCVGSVAGLVGCELLGFDFVTHFYVICRSQ